MSAPLHHRRCWSTHNSQTTCAAGRSACRVLITAGPTHEPIDAVRFIGNRSSGRMGIAVANAAAAMGWDVTLLLGPVPGLPSIHGDVVIRRFRTCADLQAALAEETPRADVLIMAAAVADYRPRPNPAFLNGKFRRTAGSVFLELDPTPDLLAETAATRRADQFFVGFALEPRAELAKSAESKLRRKRIDLVVGNPLETMDSESVEAMVLGADGSRTDTPGVMSKDRFAPWLLEIVEARRTSGAVQLTQHEHAILESVAA